MCLPICFTIQSDHFSRKNRDLDRFREIPELVLRADWKPMHHQVTHAPPGWFIGNDEEQLSIKFWTKPWFPADFPLKQSSDHTTSNGDGKRCTRESHEDNWTSMWTIYLLNMVTFHCKIKPPAGNWSSAKVETTRSEWSKTAWVRVTFPLRGFIGRPATTWWREMLQLLRPYCDHVVKPIYTLIYFTWAMLRYTWI